MNAKEAAAEVRKEFGDVVEKPVEFRDEITINVALESLHDVMAYCKGKLGFDYLVDISSLDHMDEEPRFEMVYELYSYEHGCHLRVKAPSTPPSAKPRPSPTSGPPPTGTSAKSTT